MTPPRIGISLSFQARQDRGETAETIYREALEIGAEASRLGIDDIWVSQHHGEEDGYCPSPIVAGAALAAAAPTCAIGQNIAIAPLYGHPLKLAEDLAVLDNLSGGRLQIGVGQGYRPEEYAAFGRDYTQRTRAFEECLDILKLAWRGRRFDYDGTVYRVEGGLLRPAPVNPGRPPLWIGAAAPRSRARAARYGAGLCIAPLTELAHTAKQFDDFDAEAATQGTGPLPHFLSREILLGDNAADALARHKDPLDFVYRVQYAPERTGLTYRDPESGERRALTSDDPYYLSEAFARERWFVGSPDEVADGIATWQPRLKLDHLAFHPRQPGTSLEDAVAAIERVTKEVMPKVTQKLAANEGS